MRKRAGRGLPAPTESPLLCRSPVSIRHTPSLFHRHPLSLLAVFPLRGNGEGTLRVVPFGRRKLVLRVANFPNRRRPFLKHSLEGTRSRVWARSASLCHLTRRPDLAV